MTTEEPEMTAEDFLAELGECGIDAVNNAWIAGRMPPGISCGVHPAAMNGAPGFYDTYRNGDLFGNLAEALGPAMHSPRVAFSSAAQPDVAPALTQNFDLKLLS